MDKEAASISVIIVFLIFLIFKSVQKIDFSNLNKRISSGVNKKNVKDSLIKKIITNEDLIYYIKVFALVILILSTVGISIYGSEEIAEGSVSDIHLLVWIIAYFSSLFTAYLLHFIVYKYIFNRYYNVKENMLKNFLCESLVKCQIDTEGDKNDKGHFKKLFNFFLRIITPDYSYAVNFKAILWKKVVLPKDLEEDISAKRIRKMFLQYSNWMNVTFSCLYVVLGIIIIRFQPWDAIKEFFFCYIFFRIFSRCIEIIFAFYKDVVRTKRKKDGDKTIENYKSSTLIKGNRISLAIHSYIEVIILFSLVYFIGHQYFSLNIDQESQSFLYVEFLFYSFSVSAFRSSIDIGASFLSSFLDVLQATTSLTLVVLSLATYIGLKNDKEN